MYVRHRISSQTENSRDMQISHVILTVIFKLTGANYYFLLSSYTVNFHLSGFILY
jgi:hypothetical protein